MIKKAIVMLFALFLCLAFIGCSGSLETIEPKEEVTEEVVEELEEGPEDPAASETNHYEDIIEEQTTLIEGQQKELDEKDALIEELKQELSVAKSNLMAIEEELNPTVTPEPEPEEVAEVPVKEENVNIPEETGSTTMGEKNAAKSALNYLAYMPFSYSGLVEQLKFEGYTHEEAVYGVDRCGADWNEQAALMAEEYLKYSSFSRTELIAQLEFEGFTRQQAEYGVQAVGY